ncbi:MAG TPA: tripartite tricarboxylate transporter TctB family protein [bacterium]|nr:tripartite tricarboxylate transporter TctB family protein [bacterium]HPO08421.1 tripartite tricarboxylate transporter TctB family protein [bacterium]HQO33363.1 tripartite tricarboxylate transporter TctB family protein [bacterium]HQP98605.1 tripartite tricarboxylate transporter TctB family protein [bacterium]
MRNDRILGALVLIAGIVLYAATAHFPGAASNRPGPAFLPRVLAVLFAVSGFLLILYRKPTVNDASENQPRNRFKVVAMIAGLVLYSMIADTTGFLIAGGCLTFGFCSLLGNSWRVGLVVTVVLVPFIYTIFSTVLGVVLPVGWLGW